MLGLLSGRSHLVHTGVCVQRSGRAASGSPVEVFVVETTVAVVALTPDVVEWYVGTGEPFGKAGAYALQGAGGALVGRIEGSVTNVIGLPLAETLAAIRRSVAGPPDPGSAER
jgi:septum formation protein